MTGTRITASQLEQQLGRLAAQPVPEPRPLFARQLERTLRGLAAGEGEAVVAERHRPVARRWTAAIAVAVAVVTTLLVVRPGVDRRPALTHVRSTGDVPT